ncbi:MAG: hypothetical protein LBQ02_04270 [Candidatus Nomurabacteria bacterium]|jgi:DNA repair exonuclease SbcCD ATPase subunit|nr:hypothetical protein [Candidatus Nomurabacteria bacterium]
MDLKFTDHVLKRYVERAVEHKDVGDIPSYVAVNRSRLETEMAKMVHYSEEVYRGPTMRDPKPIAILFQRAWVIVQALNGALITLFKKDLGLNDEELNNTVTSRCKEIILEKDKALKAMEDECKEREEKIKLDLEEVDASIKRYHVALQNLEEYKRALEQERKTMHVKVEEKRQDLMTFLDNFLRVLFFGTKSPPPARQ